MRNCLVHYNDRYSDFDPIVSSYCTMALFNRWIQHALACDVDSNQKIETLMTLPQSPPPGKTARMSNHIGIHMDIQQVYHRPIRATGAGGVWSEAQGRV